MPIFPVSALILPLLGRQQRCDQPVTAGSEGAVVGQTAPILCLLLPLGHHDKKRILGLTEEGHHWIAGSGIDNGIGLIKTWSCLKIGTDQLDVGIV